MNNNTNKTILITGPNASGKSIILKNTILCIYLAQTLGFSPCKKIIMNPFQHIETYFTILDNPSKDKSLYQMEIYRLNKYIDNINNNNHNSIIAIDEIFNSTNYNNAIKSSNKIINKLNKKINNLSIITTHHFKLIKNKNVTNYSMKINYENNLNTTDDLYSISSEFSINNNFKLYLGIDENKTNLIHGDYIEELISGLRTGISFQYSEYIFYLYT